MNEKLSITVSSVPHRELPIAELWSGDWMWAEIHQDEGAPRIQLFPDPRGKPWDFDLIQFERLIEEAKQILLAQPAHA